MLIHPGTQERLIAETTTAAGTTIREGSIQSDSLLVTLHVSDVISGSLQVSVVTLVDDDGQTSSNIITFPVLNAPTVNILLRKAAVSMQRFRITATYSGVCTYKVYVRAIEGAGESSARILGSSDWRVSQLTVGTSPVILIAASLDDRSGILVKNWSVTQTIYISEDSIKADAAVGYPLAPRDALALDIAAGAQVWAVSDAAGADIRLAEAGG